MAQAQGDIEQPVANQPCPCTNRWDVNNQRLPAHLPEGDNRGVRLYNAALKGDWGVMKGIIINDRTILCSSLTEAHETVLHVAVNERRDAIVKKLVGNEILPQVLEREVLESRNIRGNTAFCVAVGMGSVEIAKILMRRRREVVLIRGANNRTPLYIAVAAGDPEMIRSVYQNFEEHINHLDKDELAYIFLGCIDANLFDLANKILGILNHANYLAWEFNDSGETALGILARKPSAFAGKSLTRLVNHVGCLQNEALKLTKRLCEKISSDEQMSSEEKVDRLSGDEILFEAAKLGNDKFLAVLIDCYPDLILKRDEHERSIFHIAVLHRHDSIFKLIHNFDLQKDVLVRYKVSCPDKENNRIYYNMLHLAAKLPSLDQLSTESGAALQMQRELLWFKDVENLTPPLQRAMKDSKDNLTPRELFTEEHKKLREAGEEWMKRTAESCMIVATLVTAVVFTVTSSLPGGNNDSTGDPKNINKTMFHVFTVAGTVALYSSITSTLLFLSIFTSRYSEDDFLQSLPLRLAFGITSLLLSSLAMMVDFVAILFLTYHGKHGRVRWVPFLAVAMSIFPLVSIVVYQCPIVHDLCFSAIWYIYRTYFVVPKSKRWE